MTDKKKSKPSVRKPPIKREIPVKQGGKKNSNVENRGFTLSLGGDRSLQAYKNWILGIYSAIKPNAREDDLTEEEWVESWKKFWSEADNKDTNIDSSEPKKKPEELTTEERYPGITEQLRQFEKAELPSCPHCGSDDTASVQVGIIGRTIWLAASTKKFKLVPNMVDKQGNYFCNECKKFFD